MVSLPTPFSVTTQEFSMPTGPTPGNTILGSRANTIPSSNSLRIRGANTGASLISNPNAVPYKTCLLGHPIKRSANPAFVTISMAAL